ncbi:MAG TPA: flagellar protein FlaG [Nitrosomonas sp.]|nr:flagellar protein FlaG [Nitrosomonas sp.]
MMISSTTGIADFLQPVLPQQKVQKNEHMPVQTTVTPESSQVNKQNTIELDVKEAVNQIQHFTETLAPNLQFSIDEETGKTVVKIMDAQTQEVIRQFPSEEAISIARALGKIEGLLFHDKA